MKFIQVQKDNFPNDNGLHGFNAEGWHRRPAMHPLRPSANDVSKLYLFFGSPLPSTLGIHATLLTSTFWAPCAPLLRTSFIDGFLGTIHKGRPPQRGEGGWSKSRHSKRGCVDLLLYINPKFGQGGGRGSKNPKLLRTFFMYGP